MNNSADNTTLLEPKGHELSKLEGPIGEALRMASIASALVADLMEAKHATQAITAPGYEVFCITNDQIEDAIFATNDALMRMRKVSTQFYATLKDAR